MTQFTRAFLLCSLLFGLFSCHHSQTGPISCTINGDCPSGYVCQDKVCITQAEAMCGGQKVCSTGRDCTSHVCESGCCLSSCTSDNDCSVEQVCDGQVCRVPTSTDCMSDSDCSNPDAPHCDVSNGTCARCVSDDQCPSGATCQNHGCRTPMTEGCTSNDQCPDALPYCLTDQHLCVSCLLDRHCGATGTAYCDQTTHVCHPIKDGCDVDVDCMDPTKPHCRVADRTCVACVSNSQCSSGDRCLSDNTCGGANACASASDCPISAKFCDPTSHQCVSCEADSDCPTGHSCTNGQCVIIGCTSDAMCQSPTPYCRLATHDCVQCLGNSNCPSGSTCTNWMCSGPTGCTTDASCAGNANGPKCNTNTHACVQCLSSADCSNGQVCNGNMCSGGVTTTTGCANDFSCPIGQVCAAVPSPTNSTQLVNACKPVTGGTPAGSACAADSNCESGRCIGEPSVDALTSGAKGYCQGGCSSDADCAPRADGYPGACEQVSINWTDSTGTARTSTVNSCVMQCTGEYDCTFGYTCQPVQNVTGTAWATRCQTQVASGFTHYGGASCSKTTDCTTGICYQFPGSFTGGMCLGVCDNANDCSPFTSASCPPNGVLLPLTNGKQAVLHACWGAACASDNDCPPLWTCKPDPDPTNPSHMINHCRPL